MTIDPDNPFKMNNWLNSAGKVIGSQEDMQIGSLNAASPNDCTKVITVCANNTAFAAFNNEPAETSIGMFARATAGNGAMAVAGQGDQGTGVVGMSLNKGIGVVGRCMAQEEFEAEPMEQLVPQTGVLGVSVNGPGIRGHGGRLTWSATEIRDNPLPYRSGEGPGAIFSSGEVSPQHLRFAKHAQWASNSASAQVCLIPSNNPVLPAQAQLGDIYFVLAFGAPWPSIGQLWICTQIQETTPVWQQIQLGGAAVGGSQIPRAPSRRRSDRGGRGSTARKSVMKKKAKKKSKGT